jgi:hypothetical protein
MSYSKIKRLIANPNDHRYYDKTYAIGNEHGIVAIAYGDCERDALDEALDAGRLDCDLMSPEDFAEAEANGWYDSYVLLGNASEPVWAQYLQVNEITRG